MSWQVSLPSSPLSRLHACGYRAAFLMNVLVCRRPSSNVGAAGEGSGGGEDGGARPGGLHPEPQQERSGPTAGEPTRHSTASGPRVERLLGRDLMQRLCTVP